MFRGDRLEALMLQSEISQSELARRVGVTQATIWKLIKEPSQGSKHIHKIARELATTAEYLMDETEDSTEPGALADRRIAFRGAVPEPDLDDVQIDHIDLRLGLGGSYLDSHVEVQKRKFSRAWLREIGVETAPEWLAWTRCDGDSMEPTIRHGEVAMIDRSQVSPGMDDKVWAIAVGEVGMIKRLRVLPSGPVEIHSDNPHIPVATAVDGELHVIGRVVAVVKRL